MPSGKQRTIYFFEPVILDQNDVAQEIEDGFWKSLFGHVASLKEDDRRTTYRLRKYEGSINATKSPATDYLYLAKLRPGADWPDIRAADGTHGTLASTGAVTDLLEPAYLVSVTNTKYCAIMRSSAGPTFSATEFWLNQVCGFVEMDQRLELRPYVRADQLQRLAAAQGASRIRLHVEAEALDDAQPTSELGQAIAAAQRAVGGGVSLDMTMSFGHASPDGPGGRQLTAAVEDILRAGGVKHAEATLLVQDEDGDLVRDRTDFVRDRVTFVEEVGESEDEQPTPEVVMSAMAEAIKLFKQQL